MGSQNPSHKDLQMPNSLQRCFPLCAMAEIKIRIFLYNYVQSIMTENLKFVYS